MPRRRARRAAKPRILPEHAPTPAAIWRTPERARPDHAVSTWSCGRKYSTRSIECTCELLDVHALQHAQRNVGAGGAAAPHLAVELGLRAHAVAADAEDDVADLDARPDRPDLPATRARPSSRPCTSSAETPSHGRAGPARRPVWTRSARIGFSTSIGTNMLPGSAASPAADASRTISEPTPTSLPSRLDQRRAAPVQRRRRREDRLVEQVFPVAGERPLRHDVRERHVVGAGVIDDHHRIALGELRRIAERQRRRRRAARRRARGPSPVAWS